MANGRIRVGLGEMTCLMCGETTVDGFCYRCNDGEAEERYNHKRKGHEQALTRLVPTVSYLREGEYELAK